MVNVELIFAPADGQFVHIRCALKCGARVADALQQSGILQTYPEVAAMPLGIFAKQVTLDTVLKSGDRIEIYRPLQLDPKEKRRQRART